MSFAILKLSYNQPGESPLTGGICGTGFFINDSMAITAYHVLNERTFKPNIGFRYCCFWILSRDGLIDRLDHHSVQGYPEIDTTVLRFDEPQLGIKVYTSSNRKPKAGTQVYGIGHIGNTMPQIKAQWEGHSIVITGADLDSVVCDKKGYIKRCANFDVNTQDVRLRNIAGFELSFGTKIGMSGGPLIDQQTGEVLGLLSFGLPPDLYVKTQSFAVSIDEIERHIIGRGT